MSDLAKIILPFLSDCLVKEDCSTESGFVNLYINDTDNPTFDNEIYLMYDDSIRTEQSIKTARKLSSLIEVKFVKNRTINNKHYIIYQFYTNRNLRKFTAPYLNLNAKEKITIIKFWNDYDTVFEELLSKSILGFDGHDSIPPADYNGSYYEYTKNDLIV